MLVRRHSPALLWILLTAAATARLLLQFAAMPPFAGLDEVFHFARLEFVLEEGRNPRAAEPSISPHVERTLRRDWREVPAFAVLGADWPDAVAAGLRMPQERNLEASDIRPWNLPNYEAQQPSLYYSLAAPVASLLPHRSVVSELRLWRVVSLVFALVTVLCTAWIGWRLFGPAGMIAAALLVSTPTWLTLVARAGNDAMACASLAVALAVTCAAPRRTWLWIVEGVAWGVAFATKLYTWPAAGALLVLWIVQRPSRRRVAIVVAIGTLFVALTAWDLASRTSSPLGLFAFNRATPVTQPHIDLIRMAKITIATAIWTSGQHANALRAIPMAVYAGPIALATLFALSHAWRDRPRRGLLLATAAAIFVMFLGQIVNVLAYMKHPAEAESGLPLGGKEGWYYFVLAPLLFGVVGATVLHGFRTSRAFIVAAVIWLAGWDILIHERALFRDWRGETTPRQRDAIVRWGPVIEVQRRQIPDDAFAVGPFAGDRIPLRVAHLAAVALLTAVATRKRWERDDRPINAS